MGQTLPVAQVRKANEADVGRLAEALTRAFADDPVMCWLFPSDQRRRRMLPRFFSANLRISLLPHDEVYTTTEVAGGALWNPPGTWRLGPRQVLRLSLPMVRAIGPRIRIATRALGVIERHHPKEPHWYLAVLGTEPGMQRRGVGSALLTPVLDRCDADGLPAYLESSKESNIAFYARHGFEVRGHVDLPSGPRLWPMWREPR
ncbi:MAG TPA: GNAT family N-acetyltransferase [Acidimicrobiales bacterium]|nr:GNAT family N-acetyltransferase [Acidimicrobiales bacterium]